MEIKKKTGTIKSQIWKFGDIFLLAGFQFDPL